MEDRTFKTKREKSPGRRVFDFLSGLRLATVLLLLLFVLTWLATLEQIDLGLYATLNKYFSWKSLYLIPELKGKMIPIIFPGGYYVSALLMLNMTLGGIIRIRKGAKQIGNLVAHFGILFMLLGGGVAHHFSDRGNMAVGEGEMADVAEHYTEYVVEVAEVKDGSAERFHVIGEENFRDLKGADSRVFHFPEIPFSLRLTGYLSNGVPVNALERAPALGEFVTDEYYLYEKEDDITAERNAAAIYAQVIFEDGEESAPFIVAGASFHPFTVRDGERTFLVDMRKRLWPMPFTVKLDTFSADFHPGTNRPAKFISDVRRVENGQEVKVRIEMNQPMRYEGFTFFQASYGPPGAGPNDQLYSVFEVVKNPADQWPAWSLYIVAVGMLITFLIKLGSYLGMTARKRRKNA